jgi:hypothetical protein
MDRLRVTRVKLRANPDFVWGAASKVNLSIYLSPMPDPHNDNHHSFPVDSVHHAIVAHANPKMVSLCFELFAARRKWIVA